jgi:hypothetical protein
MEMDLIFVKVIGIENLKTLMKTNLTSLKHNNKLWLIAIIHHIKMLGEKQLVMGTHAF